jgi:hypothetical protein
MFRHFGNGMGGTYKTYAYRHTIVLIATLFVQILNEGFEDIIDASE